MLRREDPLGLVELRLDAHPCGARSSKLTGAATAAGARMVGPGRRECDRPRPRGATEMRPAFLSEDSTSLTASVDFLVQQGLPEGPDRLGCSDGTATSTIHTPASLASGSAETLSGGLGLQSSSL